MNTIMANSDVRRGWGFGGGADFGYHNIGEWVGPYDRDRPGLSTHRLSDEMVSRMSRRAAMIKSHCDSDLADVICRPDLPVIYVYRDPYDTLASWFNYLNSDVYYRYNPGFPDMRCESISRFLRRPLNPFLKYAFSLNGNFDNVVERWAAHVSGWLNREGALVMPVRYRQIIGDTRKIMSSMGRFLGLDVSPDAEVPGFRQAWSQFPKGASTRGTLYTEEDMELIDHTLKRYGLDKHFGDSQVVAGDQTKGSAT